MQMRRDPNVRAMLGKRRQAVLGREVLITTLGKRIADRKAIAKTTDVLNHIRYESICSSLLNTGQLIGFAVIRVDWVQEGNLILPKTQFVPQDRFGFVPPDPNNLTVPVATNERLNPKTEIVLVNGYELRLLTLRSPFSGERCPKGRFVVYTFDSDSAPGGLGLGYSIYPWWVVKREATKNWLLHSDRAGSPPVLGTQPEDLDENDPDIAPLIRQFENFLKSISPNGWARLPVGFEAKVMEEISGLGPDVHEKLIAIADAQTSKAILGERPFSDKPIGAYAANVSQVEDREATVTDADCNLLDEQMQEQFWSEVQRLNAPGLPSAQVHRETFSDRRKQEQQKEEQEALKGQAERDAILIERMGLVPSEEYIKETYGDGWSLGTTPPPKPPVDPIPSFYEAESGNGTKSILLALWLPIDVATSIALPDGEAPEELHITLAYFGRHQTFPQLEQAMTALRSLCNRTAPFTAQISGWGRFNASESTDGMDVIYASPDMPGLVEFRLELLNVFENITGLSAKDNHGYTPHITLAKVQPELAISVTLPTIAVQFNRLTLTHGNTHLTFPLQGDPQFSEAIQVTGNDGLVDDAEWLALANIDQDAIDDALSTMATEEPNNETQA
jgi:2'-5' RNA ligase